MKARYPDPNTVHCFGLPVRVDVDRRRPRPEPGRSRRFTCELAIFLRGSDKGHWVRPVRAGPGNLAFRFRWVDGDGNFRLCLVIRGRNAVTNCTCPDGPHCDHVRALKSCRLIPESDA